MNRSRVQRDAAFIRAMERVVEAAREWRATACMCGVDMPDEPPDGWECPMNATEEQLREALDALLALDVRGKEGA